MKGYGGRILFVDATSGMSRVEPVSEDAARQLLGGNGFAARLLLDHVPPGTDPYDPENAVIFAVGPITDTSIPGNSRALVASKSPPSENSTCAPESMTPRGPPCSPTPPERTSTTSPPCSASSPWSPIPATHPPSRR